jgi:hypothetical protein
MLHAVHGGHPVALLRQLEENSEHRRLCGFEYYKSKYDEAQVTKIFLRHGNATVTVDALGEAERRTARQTRLAEGQEPALVRRNHALEREKLSQLLNPQGSTWPIRRDPPADR